MVVWSDECRQYETAAPVSEEYLRQVRGLLGQVSPPWWSDHLAMTRAGEVEIGHLAPVPRTQAMPGIVCDNIVRAREATGCPFILENIASPLQLPGAEMGEAEFLSRQAARYERMRLGLEMRLERLASGPARFRALPRRAPVLCLSRFSWDFPSLTDPQDPVQERTTWTLFAKLPGLNGIWYW